ncbi:MAG: HD domain-containing protein [Fibromonadaceae bacterium]|jgi:putative two-component system response regulator|nr:HD domain-containing protein [Fibromonadaceae bacterium]
MERVLLISKEPEKWEFFKEKLACSYEFTASKPEDKHDFSNISIIAVDDIQSIGRVYAAEKKRAAPAVPPIVFFGSDDLTTEIKARSQGVADFFSIPFDKEMLILRFKNVSAMARLIRANDDSLRWMRMIRREMVSVQEGMAEIIAQTVESRDENTGGHILRTSMFINELGTEFVEKGVLKKEELSLIVRAAPLHDVGKIAVRDSILLKPGPLTDSERNEMKKHTKKGADLIKKMQKRFESHTYLQYAHEIALNHHEHFDGGGYPSGKKGEEIPFCARLMAVVDVYDALVSDRIYRKGMPREDAIEIIFSGCGAQFDPAILEAFDNCKDYLI